MIAQRGFAGTLTTSSRAPAVPLQLRATPACTRGELLLQVVADHSVRPAAIAGGAAASSSTPGQYRARTDSCNAVSRCSPITSGGGGTGQEIQCLGGAIRSETSPRSRHSAAHARQRLGQQSLLAAVGASPTAAGLHGARRRAHQCCCMRGERRFRVVARASPAAPTPRRAFLARAQQLQAAARAALHGIAPLPRQPGFPGQDFRRDPHPPAELLLALPRRSAAQRRAARWER